MPVNVFQSKCNEIISIKGTQYGSIQNYSYDRFIVTDALTCMYSLNYS